MYILYILFIPVFAQSEEISRRNAVDIDMSTLCHSTVYTLLFKRKHLSFYIILLFKNYNLIGENIKPVYQ